MAFGECENNGSGGTPTHVFFRRVWLCERNYWHLN